MKIALMTLILPSLAGAADSVSLSRYVAIKSCDAEKNCVGPAAKEIETANVDIQLKPFHKGGARGVDGWERYSIIQDGTRFKVEIHVVEQESAKGKYFVYTMLRSGKRHGKIKSFWLNELSDFKPVELKDEPIRTGSGTLQAGLVIGPKLKVTK